MANLDTLTEDFSSGVLDTGKWTNISANGGSVYVGTGIAGLNMSGSTTAIGGIRSAAQYQLAAGSTLSARMTMPSNAGTAYLRIVDHVGSNGRLYFQYQGSNIYVYAIDNTGATILGTSIPYDVAATYVRIRIASVAGNTLTVYFEKSVDTSAWTAVSGPHSVAFADTSCYAEAYIDAAGSANTSGSIIDNINLKAVNTASVTDDFSGASFDPAKWTVSTSGGGTASVSGGMAALAVNANGATATITADKNNYNIIGSTVSARMLPFVSANVTTELRVTNQMTSYGHAYIQLSGGNTITMFAQNSISSTVVNTTATYNASTWAYWRIRLSSAGDVVYFESSNDGNTWNVAASGNYPGWGPAVQFSLKATCVGSTGGTSSIDNVNPMPPLAPTSINDAETLTGPAVSIPPLSGLTDTFPGTTLDTAKWTATTNGSGSYVTVSGDVCYLEQNSPQSGKFSRIISRGQYSLVGSYVSAQMFPTTVTSGLTTTLKVSPQTGNGYALMQVYGSTINATAFNSSSASMFNQNASYVAANHRFWRISLSADGVTLTCATSGDGVVWNTFSTASNPGWGSFVYLQIDLVATVGTTFTSTYLDLVNLIPSAGTVAPAAIGETETLGAPALAMPMPPLTPDSIGDSETLDNATAGWTVAGTPNSASDPETLDNPGLTFAPVIGPTSIGDTETLDPPALSFVAPGVVVNPTGINDVEAVGSPTAVFPLSTLNDEFNGTLLDTTKWVADNYGGTIAVGSGVLTLSVPAGGSTVGVHALAPYRVGPDQFIQVKVTHTASSGCQTVLVLNDGVNTYPSLEIRVTASTIFAKAWDAGGTLRTNYSTAYSASSHAWWRIKFTGTGLNLGSALQVSSNGTSWSNLTTSAAYAWTGNVTVNMYLTATSGPRTTTFDKVNFAQVPISALSDDFTGTTLDTAKWTDYGDTGHTCTVANGLLTQTVVNTVSYCFAGVSADKNYYMLPGGSIYAKALPSSNPDIFTRLYVYDYVSGGNYSMFEKLGTNIRVYFTGVGSQSFTYDPILWAYWRWRADSAGTLYADRSADGVTWVNVASGPVNYVYVTAKLETVSNGAFNGSSSWDTVNLVPSVALNPDSITDTETLGAPAVDFVVPSVPVNPAGVIDGELVGTPDAVGVFLPTPDGIADAETLGSPDVVAVTLAEPDSITELETLDGPAVAVVLSAAVTTSITDPEMLGAPAGTLGYGGEPDSIAETETLADPAAGFAPLPPFPDGIADAQALAVPSIRFYPSIVNPDGITDPAVLAPSISWSFISFYNGTYSTGDYGVGPYQGLYFAPDGIRDFHEFGEPAVYSVPPVPEDQVLPLGIVDAETLDGPELPRPNASNYLYGQGVYSDGPYYGSPGTSTDETPRDNVIYSDGTYGYGIYYGVAQHEPGGDISDSEAAVPLFRSIAGQPKPPMHILGIGPWSATINWRGAPNYGVPRGYRTPRPVMALPPATSKSFTLRLGEGGEARCDLVFPRGSAIVVEEMSTDLWWRRKDPRVKKVEMVGRFNAAHVNLSTSDTGVSCSIQWDDYQTVLSSRMVLKYLHPNADPGNQSQWDVGTPVIDIIGWALPKNTGLDLSEATGTNAVDLGKTIQKFHLPPSTTIGDLMDNLESISPHPWEWWVETPDDINQPPKLRFIVGERGTDKGVTLFDVGKGPTPIAAWTRNGAADSYANTLYYTGGDPPDGKGGGGGVVEKILAQIEQYGQRDHLDGNSSVNGGDIDAMHRRAVRMLQKLADRRPSYTVELKQGWWRGRSHVDIGDTVTLILRLNREVIRDKFRVSEITVTIDDTGLEEVSLNLGRLPVSADPRSKRSPLVRLVAKLKNYVTPPGAGDIPDPND